MTRPNNYLNDLSEIRSMMERSSKFTLLSGWAGLFAGTYALVAAHIAHHHLYFRPDAVVYAPVHPTTQESTLLSLLILGGILFFVALSTAVFFSWRRAQSSKVTLWTAPTRKLVAYISIPMLSGAVVLVALIYHGLLGLLAPIMLIFYGIALLFGSWFTANEVRILGAAQLIIGLVSCFFIPLSLYFWAAGFGIVHISYGAYIYVHYERSAS